MKLVLIEWEDSHNHRGWQSIDNLKDLCGPLISRSVGWLIAEKNGHIMIAADLSATNMPDGPYGGCGNMCIPKKAIIKMTVLRKK